MSSRGGGRGKGTAMSSRGGGYGKGAAMPTRPKMRVACSAEIAVPVSQRGMIIGKMGATIQELQARTAARVTVPGRDSPSDQPVRVEAELIGDVLHVCWWLTALGVGHEEPVDCTVMTSEGSFAAALQQGPTGEFLSGPSLAAFSVASSCSMHELRVLIDIKRSAQPELSGKCLVKQSGRDCRNLIFVYGQHSEEPRALMESLEKSLQEAEERKLCELWAARAASREALPPRTFTVATYNLLHPAYAEKYQEREGIGHDGASNWAARAPRIARLLSESKLDVYFLQEVGKEQAAELVKVAGIDEEYDLHHCTHPNREAQDGVAVLLRRERFTVSAKELIPFEAKEDQYRGQKYMCAAATFASHIDTGLRFVLISVHFYAKKAVNPEATVLQFLQSRAADFDAALWGGDCNWVYTSPPPGYSGEPPPHRPTRGANIRLQAIQGSLQAIQARGKKIDWLFCSPNCSLTRCGATEFLVDASRDAVFQTGCTPSDHFAEAAVVTVL